MPVPGVSSKLNHDAILLGRIALASPSSLSTAPPTHPTDIDGVLGARAQNLHAYAGGSKGRELADRYRKLVERARVAEAGLGSELAMAAAKGYHRVLACKDEYEVARLMLDGSVEREFARVLKGDGIRLTYHLSPPFIAPMDDEVKPASPGIMPSTRSLVSQCEAFDGRCVRRPNLVGAVPRGHLLLGGIGKTQTASPRVSLLSHIPLLTPLSPFCRLKTGKPGKMRVPGWIAQPIFRLILSFRWPPPAQGCLVPTCRAHTVGP